MKSKAEFWEINKGDYIAVEIYDNKEPPNKVIKTICGMIAAQSLTRLVLQLDEEDKSKCVVITDNNMVWQNENIKPKPCKCFKVDKAFYLAHQL